MRNAMERVSQCTGNICVCTYCIYFGLTFSEGSRDGETDQ